jgi:hypothetical protein
MCYNNNSKHTGPLHPLIPVTLAAAQEVGITVTPTFQPQNLKQGAILVCSRILNIGLHGFQLQTSCSYKAGKTPEPSLQRQGLGQPRCCL